MISSGRWFERKFAFDLGLENFPLIVERLRGTPVRLEDRIKGVTKEKLTERMDGRWSIQENIGHLLTAEPLWLGRVEDLLSGTKELRPADLSNKSTDDSDYNSRPIGEILSAFRTARSGLVYLLDGLSEEQVLRSALHPRLKKPMRTLDLAYFVAEHDDHHLARITNMLGLVK